MCVVLVAQLCLTLYDPTRLSVCGVFQARQQYWSGPPFFLQGVFLSQGSNLDLLHCRQILYHLRHPGFENVSGLKWTGFSEEWGYIWRDPEALVLDNSESKVIK